PVLVADLLAEAPSLRAPVQPAAWPTALESIRTTLPAIQWTGGEQLPRLDYRSQTTASARERIRTPSGLAADAQAARAHAMQTISREGGPTILVNPLRDTLAAAMEVDAFLITDGAWDAHLSIPQKLRTLAGPRQVWILRDCLDPSRQETALTYGFQPSPWQVDPAQPIREEDWISRRLAKAGWTPEGPVTTRQSGISIQHFGSWTPPTLSAAMATVTGPEGTVTLSCGTLPAGWMLSLRTGQVWPVLPGDKGFTLDLPLKREQTEVLCFLTGEALLQETEYWQALADREAGPAWLIHHLALLASLQAELADQLAIQVQPLGPRIIGEKSAITILLQNTSAHPMTVDRLRLHNGIRNQRLKPGRLVIPPNGVMTSTVQWVVREEDGNPVSVTWRMKRQDAAASGIRHLDWPVASPDFPANREPEGIRWLGATAEGYTTAVLADGIVHSQGRLLPEVAWASPDTPEPHRLLMRLPGARPLHRLVINWPLRLDQPHPPRELQVHGLNPDGLLIPLTTLTPDPNRLFTEWVNEHPEQWLGIELTLPTGMGHPQSPNQLLITEVEWETNETHFSTTRNR
ncbi:MAG: hypothetical protein KDL31_10635, partial [Kiritimatiellae bacterium]|nr:hypothetical protein [Kiritimatiellia bacterium]